VQTIPLPGITGRLDHMGVDLERKRLFVAAVANNALEVVGLTDGKVIKSLGGLKETQDAQFLGGDFNKLYVSSLDGHVRVFQGSQSGKEIQSLPGPETMDGVYYDASLERIYMTGGRWYGTPEASPGWIYVYQQKDSDHYGVISKIKIKTRPGSGTSLLVPQFDTFYVASQAIGDQEARDTSIRARTMRIPS